MIYLYIGTDAKKARSKMQVAIESLRARAPEADILRITVETSSEYDIAFLLSEQGLFHQKRIIILDTVFATDDSEKYEESLGLMQQSSHVIFVLEEKLDAKLEKKLEKHAEKTFRADISEKKEARFDGFAITDYLGERDQKKLWLAYQRGLARGEDPERIHGLLFWAAKALLAAATSATPQDADLKDFPYQKAKRNARNFAPHELQSMFVELTELPTRARSTSTDMAYALESFILSL